MSVAAGNDNPYFDFRQRNDPGGIGYTRVSTQMQLFDTTRTACSVGLQAVTPAGLQCDGVADKMGTTVVSPAVSLFHAARRRCDGVARLRGHAHAPDKQRGTADQPRPALRRGGPARPGHRSPTIRSGNVYLSVGAPWGNCGRAIAATWQEAEMMWGNATRPALQSWPTTGGFPGQWCCPSPAPLRSPWGSNGR